MTYFAQPMKVMDIFSTLNQIKYTHPNIIYDGFRDREIIISIGKKLLSLGNKQRNAWRTWNHFDNGRRSLTRFLIQYFSDITQFISYQIMLQHINKISKKNYLIERKAGICNKYWIIELNLNNKNKNLKISILTWMIVKSFSSILLIMRFICRKKIQKKIGSRGLHVFRKLNLNRKQTRYEYWINFIEKWTWPCLGNLDPSVSVKLLMKNAWKFFWIKILRNIFLWIAKMKEITKKKSLYRYVEE